ncbi:hypothetical protein M405DRAFT_822453 [Rhizopogon salebrosus TDB-379]|nr:hypothetical protein M405DRAFT_822453 [Rhizopogon salebrosus TDB-379]
MMRARWFATYHLTPTGSMLTSSAWNLKNVPTTICLPNVMPYPVLDVPELADDVYLNLVDWSSMNVLDVGLGSCLCDLASPNDTVSSVS